VVSYPKLGRSIPPYLSNYLSSNNLIKLGLSVYDCPTELDLIVFVVHGSGTRLCRKYDLTAVHMTTRSRMYMTSERVADIFYHHSEIINYQQQLLSE
jgi:hypothetical protein